MKDLQKLRAAGRLEGLSLLVLLFIAMPLKYAMGYPLAVRIVGALHGFFFLWFIGALFQAHLDREWPLKRSFGWLIAATVPFGFLVVDKGLQAELRESTPGQHTGEQLPPAL
jgi:integral membrane protein